MLADVHLNGVSVLNTVAPLPLITGDEHLPFEIASAPYAICQRSLPAPGQAKGGPFAARPIPSRTGTTPLSLPGRFCSHRGLLNNAVTAAAEARTWVFLSGSGWTVR
jgi:hypothetical protein